ncbi:MAG: hypothetical protein H6733_15465 [Alphaproteobacteria bacterium]|nr:hypothetical protein [Alphaproteobacteria bacterium]
MRAHLLVTGLALACTPGPVDPFGDADPDADHAVFDVTAGFWASPFPGDQRVDVDSRRVDVAAFPNPDAIPLVDTLVGMVDQQVQGWATSGAIYVPFEAPVDPAGLPDLAASVTPAAKVFLVDVDEDPEGQGARYPIEVVVRDEATVYGPAHAVVALPLQGVPLPPRRRFALVVTRDLGAVDGHALAPAPAISALLQGERPSGWRADVTDQYAAAVDVLAAQGVGLDTVAGLTVFTTSRPIREWKDIVVAARGEGGMRLSRSPRLIESYDDYCVYEANVVVPVFQSGEPPYTTEGGGFTWDDDRLVVQRTESARMLITVPKGPPVPVAYPTVVFIRTGGGGDRPLVDRGPRTTPGEDVPGTGYAATFARVGWAGVQVDGPLGGVRNTTGADEQFLIFNVANPVALRDNLRQSALELALLPNLLQGLTMVGGGCEGLPDDIRTPIRFDVDHLALLGHSMGATIAPLAAAGDARYGALLLSGAGGSWIDNVVYKRKPLEVRPIAATMLHEQLDAIDPFHPVLTLLQWAGEPADPPMYAGRLVRDAEPDEARHVLMVQGLVDNYILPPIANASSLSLGLDLAGPAIDAEAAPSFRSLTEVLPLVGGRSVPLPAGLNVTVAGERNVTAVVVQHPEDGIEDGHEVFFQRDEPHRQVACFLQGLLTDQPLVPDGTDASGACPQPPETEE